MGETDSRGTVLVTGGTGYIGSHCILELLTAGYDVIAIDNLSNSRSAVLRRVNKLSPKAVMAFYQCDMTDSKSLNKVFEKNSIDFVVHFAASKNVGESIVDPFLYYKNNLVSSVNLLEAMRDHGVFHLVFSSSCAVYGDAAVFPITEAHPTGAATSAYGRTKFYIEEMIRDLTKADQRWNVISLRYFNPIGAHPSGLLGEDNTRKYSNLVPIISQVAIGQRDKLAVFGNDYDTTDGTAIRDYIHIVDLAQGHVIALQTLQKEHITFKAYNLGLGSGLTVLELIRAFEKASGKTVAYEVVARREGDVARLVCDATKARNELGWVPKHSVDDMCEHFWHWQTTNPNGYRDEEPFSSSPL